MDSALEKDIAKIKDFVRHSAEFIAYFELADSKMHEWQESLEQQIEDSHLYYEQRYEQIKQQLQSFEELLTQAGLARFRLQADRLLEQGQEQLTQVQQLSDDLLQSIEMQQQKSSAFINESLHNLDQFTHNAIQKIDQQLASYDVEHFRRIASESCDQVEKVSSDAVNTSKRLLQKIQWKNAMLAIVASLVTAFTIGLYISDEWPWELHQQAINERDAGKILIKAWPTLSQNDRNNILHNRPG